MTSPIDVVANAIRVADGNNRMGAGQLAEVAVKALDHEDVIVNAAHALFEDPAADGKDWDQCERIARTVLRSLGDV